MRSWVLRTGKSAALAGVVAALAGGATAIAPAAHADDSSQSLALSDFASQVETLGETSYGNSFTGAVVSATGVDVYANPVTDSGLPPAISGLDTAGFPVTYHSTALSYNDLDVLNNKLGDLQSKLQMAGIQIAESAPDPTTDTVHINLVPPSSSALARMRSSRRVARARRKHLTPASYTTTAASILASIAGPGYTVESRTQSPWMAADRTAGVRPFAGGDEIRGPASFCTGGFNVVGNASGHPFMLTAGHCGSGTWETPAEKIGNTSGVYWQNPTEDDFQTIAAGTTVSGNIKAAVNGNSKQYPVVAEIAPAIRAQITVDGALTGEKNYQIVQDNNARVYVNDPNGPPYYVQNVVITDGTPPVCQGGDSGGPMFLRTNAGSAKAVGTLVSYDPTSLRRCGAERIGVEERRSNTHLLLSGG